MNRELMQRALEALRMVRFDGDCLQVRTMHAVKSVIGPLSAALAAPVAPAGDKPSTSEPVATLHADGYWTAKKTEAGRLLDQRLRNASSRVDVYTAPPDVPPGWVLVPVEPTREMWDAINKADDAAFCDGQPHGADFESLWNAAIDSTPKAPT